MDQVSVRTMIENVRATMCSDTATLLLLDESGTVLQPAGSAGLGGRWRGAPYVRVGAGFAGRVAEEGRPVFLNEVNELSVLNPVLREAGVQRLVGVPVVGTHGLLGVLHVGTFGHRSFTRKDAAKLTVIADEISQRLSQGLEYDAHLAALALQRSLLPAAPPALDGIDLAVRYLPADGDLGGDWYDIFVLPDGRVGIVLGDVEGHGLGAAVVMGRLRSALRAYALEHEDPAEVLSRLDRKLCYFESDISATVLYAVAEPPFDHVTIGNAGHPIPLIAEPGQLVAEIAELEPELLLGFDPDQQRHSEKLPLPPGSALAFYTDGLVERRSRPGQVDPYLEHLGRIRRTFRAEHDAETACARIIAAGLGDDAVEDDVALVVVRRLQ